MSIWASGGSYEAYVGRWSRLVAREFFPWLAQPRGRRWLDVGCGTGALSTAIMRDAAPAAVAGIDPSAGFIAYAREQIADARVTFAVGDARTLPFAANHFDVAVSGLALNFIPNPERALAELVRVVRPGGTVAAYVWDYAGEMQLMRRFWEAVAALDPRGHELDEAHRFPLCQPGPLELLFRSAGLEHVAVRAIDVPTTFRDFDDYWGPFLGGQGAAPAYAMTLGEQPRVALREWLRASLPTAADGSIQLVARAWAVRGTAR